MDVFEELGSLALATRLKQLSENLAKDVAAVYSTLNIAFEPRWFTLFWLLKHKSSLTVTELAKELRLTHSAVVQVSNLLEKKGLLYSSKDKNDERRRQVSLSPKGMLLFKEVEPLLQAIEQANNDLLFNAAPDLLLQLKSLEHALVTKSMYERILEKLGLLQQNIEVKAYRPVYKEQFNKRSRSEVEDYVVEQLARLSVSEEETLQQGGMIFFAMHQEEVIGTVAVQALGEGCYQLTRLSMATLRSNPSITEVLWEAVKSYVASKNGRLLLLFSNPLLPEKLNFYYGHGFTAVPMSQEEQKLFPEPTIKMQLVLKE